MHTCIGFSEEDASIATGSGSNTGTGIDRVSRIEGCGCVAAGLCSDYFAESTTFSSSVSSGGAGKGSNE